MDFQPSTATRLILRSVWVTRTEHVSLDAIVSYNFTPFCQRLLWTLMDILWLTQVSESEGTSLPSPSRAERQADKLRISLREGLEGIALFKMSDVDNWIEIAKQCKYLPENDLKVILFIYFVDKLPFPLSPSLCVECQWRWPPSALHSYSLVLSPHFSNLPY